MGSSYAGIRLAKDAAVAAKNNFDLIKDNYTNGTVSILVLLDAQSATLDANLNANISLYNFLIDLFEVERAIGRYAILRVGKDNFNFITNIRELENIEKK